LLPNPGLKSIRTSACWYSRKMILFREKQLSEVLLILI
jgi:hypothetical protein